MPGQRYAFATFLGPRAGSSFSNKSADASEIDADPYFTSIRLLGYQLLHAPNTRPRNKIPFLVLALPSVPREQTAILEAEGATIVPIDPLDLPATFRRPEHERSRFRDVLSKLRVWQQTDYDRILVIDADTVVLESLDAVFTDPALSVSVQTVVSESSTTDTTTPETAPIPQLPSNYLLAASADTWGNQSEWLQADHPVYLCACFMLLQPSTELFTYYESILNQPKAPFDAAYPDQDLLIYAHRADGPMPWRRIPIEWSANDGNFVDRSRSVHVKAWHGAEGANVAGKERVRVIRDGLLHDMEAFYASRLRDAATG